MPSVTLYHSKQILQIIQHFKFLNCVVHCRFTYFLYKCKFFIHQLFCCLMEITLWWWQTIYKAPHHVSTKHNWHLNKSTLRQCLQNWKVRRFLKRVKFSSFICMAKNLSQPWKHRAGNIIPLTRYQSNFPILCQLSFLRHFAA